MLFGLVDDNGNPALALLNLMTLDCNRPQDLNHVGNALSSSSYAENLDKALMSLLTVLDHVHKQNIVH